jgi:uncharacterized DUF497 family protein
MKLHCGFEWDEIKAAVSVRQHAVPFEYATRIFLDEHRLDAVDDRHDYGEARRLTLGQIEERVFVVVYTVRGDVIRLISARKANGREIRRYEALSPRSR